MNLPVLGLTGFAGAGKDTVFDRLVELGGSRFVRLSVAEPLKESVAARWGVDIHTLEQIKRDGVVELRSGSVVVARMSLRQYLQNDGTQGHRGVFGEDFWLDTPNTWVERAETMLLNASRDNLVVVNTSVRFENEARRIIEMGGQVWRVDGPQDTGAGGHESEERLPDELIAHVIDNTVRVAYRGEGQALAGRFVPVVDFSHLDDQIATLLHGGTLA